MNLIFLIPICAAAAFVLVFYLLLFLRTPRRISWTPTALQGVECSKAERLILQHAEDERVWATRDFTIYLSEAGGDFTRVKRMTPPFGENWGGYSRYLQDLFGYQELLEVFPLSRMPDEDYEMIVIQCGGELLVGKFADGRIVDLKKSGRLRWFGRGQGRGFMAHGICEDAQGRIYYAEYMTCDGDHDSSVWRSDDRGESWHQIYRFEPGMIRHIHCVQCDPVDNSIWIGTGDRDEHCHVGRSTDGGKSFEWIDGGHQMARTCSFTFFDDAVLWATDADFEQNHVVVWNRYSREVSLGSMLPTVTYNSRRIGRIEQHRAIIGLAQSNAELRMIDNEGNNQPLFKWPIEELPPTRGPSPRVRLARGYSAASCAAASAGNNPNRDAKVYFNPLRTLEDATTIFRVETTHLKPPQ